MSRKPIASQPRSHAPSAFIKANNIAFTQLPVQIPSTSQGDFGKLVLKKENGAVKGFEYQCVCGHKDYFVCE